MDHLTREFLTESLEGLERVDRCLTDLEARPENTEVLGEVFRCIHTIKGTTGFLGMARMEKLAHAGEYLLVALRDGRQVAREEVIDVLLKLVDCLRSILRLVELTGGEGERVTDEDGALIGRLRALTPGAESSSRRQQVAGVEIVPAPDLLAGSGGIASHSSLNDNTVRLDVELLNRMMDLVGDLVLVRNQILQSRPDAALSPQLARRLDTVTADLRETVMQARLQPVGYLFSKFPRMVRDLARSCGKVVRLELSGQETGLDKSLLEAVKDPIAHAIRNCIDHGIESPGARLLAGKPAQGVLSMRAFHQNGSVIIDIFDDGAGIAIEQVLRTGVERGFVRPDQASAMSEREILQLVFEPGFSTSKAATLVSGRGVGMDVIRTNMAKVGGSVELQSVRGSGTHLRLIVPLTLAIVPALVVESGGQSFCLPQSSMVELIYLPRREAEQAIEWMGKTQLYGLRDQLLPMIWLDELMDIAANEQSRQDHGFYLAVLEAEGCRFGLAIDNLRAPEEIVLKPLSDELREIGLFSGATMLGDGTLALILDVPECAQRAGVRPLPEEAMGTTSIAPPIVEEQHLFVIFKDRAGAQSKERSALPLEVVERIESITVDEIEFAHGRPVLQSRTGLLALQDPHEILAELARDDRTAKATILICSAPIGQGLFGIVVREVLDVAAGRLIEGSISGSEGGLAMIQGRLTTIPATYALSGMHNVHSWPEVA